MPRTKVENSHPTLLEFATCMAIYGSGVRITGWTIILRLQEMAVLIRTIKVHIEWPAAGHGMSHQSSVAARRGCGYWDRMQMSLWGYEWPVEEAKLTQVATVRSKPALCRELREFPRSFESIFAKIRGIRGCIFRFHTRLAKLAT